jgi:hypothetical protein
MIKMVRRRIESETSIMERRSGENDKRGKPFTKVYERDGARNRARNFL